MAKTDREQRIEELAQAGIEPFPVAQVDGGKSGIMVVYPPIGSKGGTLEIQKGGNIFAFFGPDDTFVGNGELELIPAWGIDEFNQTVAAAKEKFSAPNQ